MAPKIDEKKRSAILHMIALLWGRQTADLLELRDGKFYLHVLGLLEPGNKDVHPSNEVEWLLSIQKFLQDYYGGIQVDKFIKFDAIMKSEMPALVELELAKIALVLIGIGVLDKNGKYFMDAAMKVPEEMHQDIVDLIQSVVQAGSTEFALTENIEKVLIVPGNSAFSPPIMCQQKASTPKDRRHTTTASFFFKDSPLRTNTSLNCSLQDLSSPLRGLSIDTTSSSSLLMQFVQSPQLIQKASLNQKELEIRKLKQQLNDEIYMKDELKFTIQDHISQCAMKDSEIAKLQSRIKELVLLQDAMDDLQELKLSYREMEDELFKYKNKVLKLQDFEDQAKHQEKEINAQCEEMDKLRQELSLLKKTNEDQKILQQTVSQLQNQVESLRHQLEEMHNVKQQWESDKEVMLSNFHMVKEANKTLRQELDELHGTRNDTEAGENMSVFVDIQLRELMGELKEVKEERDALFNRLMQMDSLKAEFDKSKIDFEQQLKEKSSNHEKELEDLQIKHEQIIAESEEQKAKLTSQLEASQAREEENNSELKTWKEKSNSLMKELENVQLQQQHTVADYKEQISDMTCKLEVYQSRENENNSQIVILKEKSHNQEKELEVLHLKHQQIIADFEDMSCQLEAYQSREKENNAHLEILKDQSSNQKKELEVLRIKHEQIIAESEEQNAKLTSQLEASHSREEENNSELKTWQEKSNSLMKELENVQLQQQHTVADYKEQISDMACRLEVYQSREKENNLQMEISKDESSNQKKELEVLQIQHEQIIAEMEEHNAKLTIQLEAYQSREEENNSEMNSWKEKFNTLMKELENVQLQQEHTVTDYKEQISDMACKLEAYQSREKENSSQLDILKEKSCIQEKELEVLQIKQEQIIAEFEERIAKLTSQLEAYQSKEEENNQELKTWKEQSNSLMKELEHVQLQQQHSVTDYKEQISDMACKLEAYQSREKENNSLLEILKEKSNNQEKESEVLQTKHEQIIAEFEEQITKLTSQLEAYQSREQENISELNTWKEKSSNQVKESEDLQIENDQIVAEFEEQIAKLTSQLEAYQSREEENILELNTWKEKSSIHEKESEDLQIKHDQIVADFEEQITKLTSQLEAYQSREEENISELNTLKVKSSNQEKESEVLQIKHEKIIAEFEERVAKHTSQLEAYQSREEENILELNTWKEKSSVLEKESEDLQIKLDEIVAEFEEQIAKLTGQLEAYQSREQENISELNIWKEKSSIHEKKSEDLQTKQEEILAQFEERIFKLTSQLEAYQSREEENISELNTLKEKSSNQEKESEVLQIKHEQIIAEFEERIAKLTGQLEASQSREEENNQELNTYKEQSNSLMKELENVQLQQQHTVTDYKKQLSDMACKLEAYHSREKESNSQLEIVKAKSSNQEKELEDLQIKHEQIIAEFKEHIVELTIQLEAYQSREEENNSELNTWKEKSSIHEKEAKVLQIKHEQINAEFEERIAKLTNQLEAYQSREEVNNSELNSWKEQSNSLMKELENVQVQQQQSAATYKGQITDMACTLEAYQSREKENITQLEILKGKSSNQEKELEDMQMKHKQIIAEFEERIAKLTSQLEANQSREEVNNTELKTWKEQSNSLMKELENVQVQQQQSAATYKGQITDMACTLEAYQSREKENITQLEILKGKSSNQEKELEDMQMKHKQIIAEFEERIAKLTSQLEANQSREEVNNTELKTWKEQSNSLMKELEHVQLQQQHSVTDYKEQISDMACKLEAYQSREKESNSQLEILKEKSSNQEKELDVLQLKHEQINAEFEERIAKLSSQLKAYQSRDEENNSELNIWKEQSNSLMKEIENIQIQQEHTVADFKEQISDMSCKLEAYQSREKENNSQMEILKEKSSYQEKELDVLQLKQEHINAEFEERIAKLSTQLEAYQSREEENNSELNIWKEQSNSLMKELENVQLQQQQSAATYKGQITDMACTLEAYQSKEKENNSQLEILKAKSSNQEKELEVLQIKHEQMIAEFKEQNAKLTSQLEAHQSREKQNNSELNTWKEQSNSLMKQLENVEIRQERSVADFKEQISDMACKLQAYQSSEKEYKAQIKILEEKSSSYQKELGDLQMKHEQMIAEFEERIAKLTSQLEAYQAKEEGNNLDLKTWKDQSQSLMKELENVQIQQERTVADFKEQISDTACKLEAYQSREKENNAQLEILKSQQNYYESKCKSLQEENRSLWERETKRVKENDGHMRKANEFCQELRKQLDEEKRKREKSEKGSQSMIEQCKLYDQKIQKMKEIQGNLNKELKLEREKSAKIKKHYESEQSKYEEMRQKLEIKEKENKAFAFEINQIRTSLDFSERQLRDYKHQLEQAGTALLGDQTHFKHALIEKDFSDDSMEIRNSFSSRSLRSRRSIDNETLKPNLNETIISADRVMLKRDTLFNAPETQSRAHGTQGRQTEDRLSICSVSSSQSIKSANNAGFLPNAMSCANEPEGPEFEWDRLSELQRRNTLCPPHMKSSYPVEMQTVKKEKFADESLRLSLMPDKRRKASPARSSSSRTHTASSNYSEPITDKNVGTKRKSSVKDSSDEKFEESPPKQLRTAPAYQRPGPPTPGKQPRRISGMFTPSHGASPAWSGKVKALGSPIARPNPRFTPKKRTPRRSPRFNINPVGVSENDHDRRESVAFQIGFSPRTSKGPKKIKKGFFGSKSKCSTKSEVPDQKSKPEQQKRTPLAVRNFLETKI